jgi:hypothetical protein
VDCEVVALVIELDEGWVDMLEELDSDFEEELEVTGTDEETDSLTIKLVVGIVIEVIDEGIEIAQPDKINAKNGIAMPSQLNVVVVFINKVYRIQFKKKEFSASFVGSAHPL